MADGDLKEPGDVATSEETMVHGSVRLELGILQELI